MRLSPLLSLIHLTLVTVLPTALSLTLHLLPPSSLPNNFLPLPPSTHATLTTNGTVLTAPLRRSGTFTFAALTAGSYLGEIYSRDVGFAPLRVDVHGRPDRIDVWQTFRGQEWGVKGERIGGSAALEAGEKQEEIWVEVRGIGRKAFYEEKTGFSPLTILKNPMILIAIVGMGMMIGMPYLMDSMDPEMRKEFEEQQKSSPLANVNVANPMAGFDIAAWMAGSGSGSGSGSKTSGSEEGKGGGGGGGNKARKRA